MRFEQLGWNMVLQVPMASGKVTLVSLLTTHLRRCVVVSMHHVNMRVKMEVRWESANSRSQSRC